MKQFQDSMRQFRRAFRKRFMYYQDGKEREGLSLLITFVWFFMVGGNAVLSAGMLLRGEGQESSAQQFQSFLFFAVLFAVIYWLCYAKDELIPDGDVRLTANISEKHHRKLEVAASKLGTTISEIIEQLIDESL